MEEKIFKNTLILIKRLYGFYFRLKEIHWKDLNDTTHGLTDTISYNLINRIDQIMEIVLSKTGRDSLNYGDVVPDIVICECPIEIVERINKCLVAYKKSISQSEEYAGLNSVIDSTLADININEYRSHLE